MRRTTALLCAMAAACTPAAAAAAGETRSLATDIVRITDVAPEPSFTSGIVAVVVRIKGTTRSGARTYFIPFFELGQTMPRVGEICRIRWHGWPGFSALADTGSVNDGRWVNSFGCGRRNWPD